MPIVSLERCTAVLHLEEIKADRTGFRALGADAATDRLFGILWHQRLQLCFGALMVEKGLPRVAEQTGKFRFEALISTTDGFDARLWWLDTQVARGLAALDATPELVPQ